MFEKAVKEGMTDFTLYRVPHGWQASSRWHSSAGWTVSTHKNLDMAIDGALNIKKYAEDTGEDLV